MITTNAWMAALALMLGLYLLRRLLGLWRRLLHPPQRDNVVPFRKRR